MKYLTRVVRPLVLIGLLNGGRVVNAQTFQLFLPATHPMAGSVAKQVRDWRSGSVLVLVPPIASVDRSKVLDVRGVTLPVTVESGAEESVPDPHLYRVILEVSPDAQAQIQGAIDRYCGSGADLQIAVDETVVSSIVLVGCNRFEPSATFTHRTDAERFAHYFSDRPLTFVLPSPTTSREPASPTASRQPRRID